MTISSKNRLITLNLPVSLIEALKYHCQKEGFTLAGFCRKAIMENAEQAGAFNREMENPLSYKDNLPCYESLEIGLEDNPLINKCKPKSTIIGIYCASIKMRVRKEGKITPVVVYTPALGSKKLATDWRQLLIDSKPDIFYSSGCKEYLLVAPDFSEFA